MSLAEDYANGTKRDPAWLDSGYAYLEISRKLSSKLDQAEKLLALYRKLNAPCGCVMCRCKDELRKDIALAEVHYGWL